ncbi:MAG: DEAD/DEAH box helicase [Bacteroidetes bacterium]|nr:DEAD/DEAH box helicase [Bacteroidota bacterium]
MHTRTRKPQNGNSRPANNRARPNANRARKPKPKNQSKLNPKDLLNQAQAKEVSNFEPSITYEESALHPKIKSLLKAKGYTYPTEIQEKSLDALLAGRDLLGIAKTGSGKTAAFLLPILQKQIQGKHQALVLAPTRELALQIEEEYRSLNKGLKLYSSVFIGGTNMNADLRKASMPSDLIVATPGRLLDLYQRRAISFKNVDVLVIDEFDRLLDMGFEKDLNKILDALPHRRQNLLFSATLDKGQERRIAEILDNPVRLQISSGELTNDHVQQELVYLEPGDVKIDVLKNMLDKPEFERVIIFAETKRWVSKVNRKLRQAGIRSDEIHGDKSQNYRQKALKSFKTGKLQALIATDVAARGIDVDDVSHVINYQIPKTMDSYIHRVGRTGRAGKTGIAYTFVEPKIN